MVRKNIKLFSILTLSIIILLIPFISNVSEAAVEKKQRIYDYGDLLNSSEVEELEELAEKYSTKRETDFVILTTDNTKGKDVVKYTEDFYDKKGLGYDKSCGNCAILTIDMEHREVYLTGFYKGEEYLDDYRLDEIRYKITPDLSDGNYYEAFHTFIKTSYKYMGIKPGVDPNNILFNNWFQLIISLIIAGVAVGIMAYNSGGKVTVNQGTYQDYNTSRVRNRKDNYIRTTVTKRRKPSSDDNNHKGGMGKIGGGGGGVTSGGHSHSGSRGSF